MPVRVTRKRGKYWYAGGTVKVGKESVEVEEYSTGCGARADAENVAARRDTEVRQDLLGGDRGRARRVTVADCIVSYISRPGGVKSYDIARLNEFNEMIGARPLVEAASAWQSWLAQRGAKLSPVTVARSRATLQAAINHGAAAHSLPAIRLPGVRGGAGTERVIYLPDDQRRALLAAYNAHAMCPVLVQAYQGMRTQEALRLDWRNLDFRRRSIHLPGSGTKSGKPRTMPMHPKVDALLFGMWCAAGKPTKGPVFLSARGEPYADTRGREGGRQGGNPLARAHETACRVAGVTGFRVHDWRHDWAARMIMAGVDIRTLMDLGGWASLRMVQRYAAVTGDHMAEAIRRIA